MADAMAAVASLVKSYAEAYRPAERAGGAPFFVEADRVLEFLESVDSPRPIPRATYGDVETRLEGLRERRRRSHAAGTRIPLVELEERFALPEIDSRLILMAAAPRVVAGFEEVYGYLNNDMTRRGITPALAAAILDMGNGLGPAVLRRLQPTAPLMCCRVLELENGALTVPPAVLQYVIAEGKAIDEGDFAVTEPPIEAEDEKAAARVAEIYAREPARFHFVVAGDNTRAWAFGAAASRLCRLNRPRRPPADEDPTVALRDAALGRRAVALADPEPETLEAYKRAVEAFPPAAVPLVFVMFEEPESFRCDAKSRYVFPFPAPERRAAYWRFYATRTGFDLGDEADVLAYDYRLSGDDVAAIVAEEAEQIDRGGLSDKPDFRARCREYSSRVVSRHLSAVRVDFRFDDIVLPPKSREQLSDLVACVRNRRTVLEEWGFAAKLSLGIGISALFSGPSGTGKTMAAGIIANELEHPLFRVDLSSVVSKYIGETEKNLKQVFEAAQGTNAVLFFDEADALFGKRTEVRDAHDRYANIEVSFLLQQMEEYAGLAILATNKKDDLDQAFLRRLQFAVEYPFPNEELREAIWRKVFPSRVPISEEVDFSVLASKYELAGGNIKNAALLSAYLAADRGTAVGGLEILTAIRREYEKLGRICPRD